MIIGAHSIIYSTNAVADRAFLRDVLGLTHVDVGDGWLIFGLPPSEVAVHPGSEEDGHEFYLLCDDVEGFVRHMKSRGRGCSPVQSLGWGMLTHVTLPGGGKLGVYQPRHARPKLMSAPGAATSLTRPAPRAKTAAKRKTRTKARTASKTRAPKPAAKTRGAKKKVAAKVRRR